MIDKEGLIKKIAEIPAEQLHADLAEMLIGVSKVVENLGLKDGVNIGKISGLVMKMQINPKGFNEDLGLSQLSPIYTKYQSLFD